MRFIFLLSIFVSFITSMRAQETCPVIPAPVSATRLNGFFTLTAQTPVVYTSTQLREAAAFFQQELLRTRQLALSTQPRSKVPFILLELKESMGAKPEQYTLTIQPSGIVISAGSTTGILYGTISLLQLMEKKGEAFQIPAWQVEDAPLYAWRGLMLDESRHFFGKEKIKSILNWMCYYKLNRFHWHITDEPGWRIEIQKYPLLALVGGIGNYTNANAPALYYTQEEVKEIVAYAAQRSIEVIPEIDMPGHATAANKAYPAYDGGGSTKHPAFTFHPGKEETYQYLTNILKEVNAIFPSNMIHLGGDEVSYGNEKWKTDTLVQQLMNKHGLTTLKAVETYFMQRMADSMQQLQNKVLVWDEMADANLSPENTLLFWWRHDKPEQLRTALQKGYQTILCPRLPFYFDFVQDSTHRSGRKWGGKQFNTLENVYAFSARNIPGIEKQRQLIQGIQANLWTETVADERRLDYLLFPRISALAEAGWSREKDYTGFLRRLKKHLPLYDREKIYYFNPFEVNSMPEPVL